MTGYGKVRASSVLGQHTVRDTLKRRDKPFKADSPAPPTKKKKLELHISYKAPPAGFVFLPLGTPELADLCKEISSENNFPVNIVHAKPSSKIVLDPGKVSHHLQRIGYHFRADVVERACRQLKYTRMNGKFISEAELQKMQHASVIASAMSKLGLDTSGMNKTKEPPEQVAAVIKELFPSIPDSDLAEVVKHAWEEDSKRVGTIETIDLSRRVQLAVIARIRHEYTDYDRLLKAFGWSAAREEVEPDCLKKLIEWRGEQGEGEDDGLNEIVRETMIDDDAPRLDYSRGTPAGDASDTSLEVVHRPAMANDLRAESPQERLHPYLGGQPAQRSFTERNDLARAKIDAMRGQMRAQAVARPAEVVTRINVDARNPAPDEIIIDGVRMRRAPAPEAYPMPVQQPRQNIQEPYRRSTQPPAYRQPALNAQMFAQRPNFPQVPGQLIPAAYEHLQPQLRLQPQVQQPAPQAQYLSQPQQIMYRPQDVPIQTIEPSRSTPDHRRTRSGTLYRSEALPPRYGEPAYPQYRQSQLDGAAQQQLSPQKPGQQWAPPNPMTQYQVAAPQYHIQALPPYTTAQIPLQPQAAPQYLPQYPVLPRHGAPAPVQPAYMTSTLAPPPQQPPAWYGR